MGFENLGFEKLTQKNLLRIPKKVLEHLVLNPGDVILFQKGNNSEVIIMKGKVTPAGGK